MNRIILMPWLLAIACGSCRAENTQPAEPVQAEPERLSALRQVASPVRDDRDLNPLVERMGRARLVLLGEASHGTREFYTRRMDLSLRLIREHGSRFIAVEGDWAALYRLNRYIQGGTDAPPSALDVMRGFERWPTWMWANEETLELVEALREWNESRPGEQPVGLYGIDLYGPGEALELALRTLHEKSPGLGTALRRRLEPLAPLGADPQGYVQSLAQGAASLEPAAQKALDWVDAERDALQALCSETLLLVEQTAHLLHHAERHYREMLIRGPASWNSRADHFWRSTSRLLDHHGPDARGIVWAHNTHIGDARATPMAAQGQRNIGQLARAALGRDQVFALGFATHRGAVKAGRSWGAERERMTVPAAREGSLEDWLGQLGKPTALLSFFPRDSVPEALLAPFDHRAIGVLYQPEREHLGNYVPSVLPERYDALLFIAETRALTPVEP